MSDEIKHALEKRADAGADSVLVRIRAAVPEMTDGQAAILKPALAIAWIEGWYAAGDATKPLMDRLSALLGSTIPDAENVFQFPKRRDQ